LFGFVPLPWPLLATSVLIVTAYVLSTEAVKIAFFRNANTRN
jgi:hypothetical protein